MAVALPISTSAQPVDRASATTALPEFSLVAGGPLFRLFCRAHLGDAELGFLGRRICAFVLRFARDIRVLRCFQFAARTGPGFNTSQKRSDFLEAGALQMPGRDGGRGFVRAGAINDDFGIRRQVLQ